MISRKRAKIGDVFLVNAGDKDAYIYYAGKHSEYGDGIFVFSDNPAEDDCKCVVPRYFTFYPLQHACRQGLVIYQGNNDRNLCIPSEMRRAGARRADGTVKTWIVSGGDGDMLVQKLLPIQRKLPIAAIWNHEMLCLRLERGWKPDDDF